MAAAISLYLDENLPPTITQQLVRRGIDAVCVRDYNALVVSWSGIGEVAAQQREATARGDKTQQMSLFGDEE